MLNLILENEREAIRSDQSKNLFKWESNWLRMLFKKEFKFNTKNELIKKLNDEDIKFITFNYDRSLEYFIFNDIKNYYGIKEDKEVISIYNIIKFHHVYGKISPLEWEADYPAAALKFGDHLKQGLSKEDQIKILYNRIENIKIINEDRKDLQDIKKEYRLLIEKADEVHILGFGFLKSNCELLGIEECKQSCPDKKIPLNKFYCTTYLLSDSQNEDIIKKFGSAKRVALYESNIYDYMHNHY